MSGTDEEQCGSIGIGPPSNIGVPAGESVTGDPVAAPRRSRLWPPSESEVSPLGGRWLFPPQQLPALDQQLLKEELGCLARDPATAVAVAVGAAPGEVWLVLPVRTDQLSEAAQATLRRR